MERASGFLGYSDTTAMLEAEEGAQGARCAIPPGHPALLNRRPVLSRLLTALLTTGRCML